MTHPPEDSMRGRGDTTARIRHLSGYRYHLLTGSASATRATGDKGREQWRPDNRAFWGEYAQARARRRRSGERCG